MFVKVYYLQLSTRWLAGLLKTPECGLFYRVATLFLQNKQNIQEAYFTVIYAVITCIVRA